jgi:hypothetical protein
MMDKKIFSDLLLSDYAAFKEGGVLLDVCTAGEYAAGLRQCQLLP